MAIAINLEKRLSQINGRVIENGDISRFGDAIKDFARPHRDDAAAQILDFRIRPVMGTHLLVLPEGVTEEILKRTSSYGYGLVGQQAYFSDAVYPGEPINWVTENTLIVDESQKTFKKILTIPNPVDPLKPRMGITSQFSKDAPIFTPPNQEDLVYRVRITIEPQDVDVVLNEIGASEEAKMPYNLGAIRSVSGLLSFLEELNARRKDNEREVTGINRAMDSTIYRPLQLGEALIEVYDRKKRPLPEGKTMYIFDTALYQEGQPVVKTEVKAVTNGELNTKMLLEKLAAAA